ncbi:MAG: tetratricopeptide repeat protein [Firmicutes bacterium]|nr:tetratricopeptide repeat protein [Bacillota bacterium]
MPALKRLGLVKVLYFLLLLLIPAVLIFLYVDKTIDLASCIVLSIASLVFFGLNLHDQKKILIMKEKKMMEKAEVLIQKREWNQAIQLFNEIILMNSHSYKAAMGKGYCFRQKTDYIAAIDSYKQAVKMKKDVPEIHFLLGICYFKERMMKESLTSFETIIALNPDYLDAYIFLGDLHQFWGDADLAKKYYKGYLSRCNDDKMKATIEEKVNSVSNGPDTEELEYDKEPAGISIEIQN